MLAKSWPRAAARGRGGFHLLADGGPGDILKQVAEDLGQSKHLGAIDLLLCERLLRLPKSARIPLGWVCVRIDLIKRERYYSHRVVQND
ncbi:hypothetical protein AV530_001283 [Patagioenas fasciata monilis]|uniref:Uncharacterized protein n=1 Tax=Patagioenas fasciata monilis TaxID=372326 RepID=A0A1V4JQI5_PATFA|nr:hypothetical protein AV530_001283 [Patagioenas fasciata monilis]